MKRTRKTERRIATQRQDDIARQRRTAGRRGYTEEQLHKVLPPVTEPENRHDRKLGPLRKDADALDRAVHELELVNYERSQRGEKTLSYGQWSYNAALEKWMRQNKKLKTGDAHKKDGQKQRDGGTSMAQKEIIAQLEDLKTDRESLLDKDDPEDVFQRDIEALDGAVGIIKRLPNEGKTDEK